MSLEFEESLASSGSVLDHWPVPDRDIPQFPSLAEDGTIEINSYLLAFLKLDGVGWNDYQVQREQSGLSVEDSRLRTYRKMFERIGIIYPKSGIIRLATLGLSIQELQSLKGAELKASFSALKYQAVDILSRYQLINPAEIENRKLPLSCDVLPYVCLWKVMSSLEGKLHVEELNRIVLRIMNMREISSYVARIIRAREQADNYGKLNETELRKLLGIPVITDQPSARLASLFSLAGWGGLLIERAARRDGFRHFTEDGPTLVKKYVDDSPIFFESPDVDSWFKHYSAWARSQSVIDGYITQFQRQCLSAYKEQPILVTEHYRIERSAAQGGYGRRQLYELIQNGADALINYSRGQIQVLLTNSSLYCANEGQPFTLEGVDSILTSHISRKRGPEIGRFGLGFKSVLGVTSTPKLFSRSGSFVFDAARSENVIKQVIPNASNYPTLRIAFVTDPEESGRSDSALSKFMTWADTIVELPRNLPESEWLSMDMAEFPAQFLLFCPHVNRLILENRTNNTLRDIRVSSKERNIVSLDDGDNSIL